MLSDDVTTAANDDLPRPPAGRRAASRPSGPPAPVTEIPAAKKPARKTAKKAAPAKAAAAPAEPVEGPSTSSGSVKNAGVGSAGSVKNAGVGSADTAATSAEAVEAPKRTTRTRTRAPRKAAAAPVEAPATPAESGEAPSTSSGSVENAAVGSAGSVENAGVGSAGSVENAGVGSAGSVENAGVGSAGSVENAGVGSADTAATSAEPSVMPTELVEAPATLAEAVDAPAKAPARKRTAKATTAKTAAKKTTAPRTRSRAKKAEEVLDPAEQITGENAELTTPIIERPPLIANPSDAMPVLSPAETEAALADLAAAIAAEPIAEEIDVETLVESVADAAEAADAEAEAEQSETDEEGEQGAPRRRRRRRGGRRRRRSTDAATEGEESDEDAESPTEDKPEGESEDADKTDETDAETTEQESSDGTTHRRRRRRRRGEDTSGDDDPDTEVVVRVREPRSSGAARQKASDQVTGIDGSTRVEAKRQRRREGRAAGRRRAPILSESEFLSRRESVNRVMTVRQKPEYTQIAVLEDGILVEHYVDRASSKSLIGNIYLGRVQNVLPGMEAAFIDIGRGRNAVLYAGEVEFDAFGEAGASKKMEDVFKSGQSVIVQVTKDPVGAKGARLTSHISLPGRYIVYAPGGELSGISRKLPDTERARLKGILDELTEQNESFIVRTAAEGVDKDELQRDVTRLKAQWEAIQKKSKQGSAPQLLYAEPDATVRIVRDLFTEDFAKLVIAGDGSTDDAWESIHAYVEHVAPHLVDRMEHWDGDKGDIFGDFRIDEQIQKALERKVFLPSGGSLVIDRTEAMTVIDVNTGKFTGSGGNLEETVTRNNLEAAEEIVRQLRLRDIGGIIVIDFIDMVLPSNRELLLRRLVECLGRDRTRHQVAEVTSLGLVQMTRKKIGTGLAEAFTQECETCKGRGYHRHTEPIETQAPSDGGDRSERKQNHTNNKGKKRASTAKKPKSTPVKAEAPAQETTA